MNITRLFGAAAAATLVFATPVAADYPERPIRVVIPFTAGGGSDVLARALQTSVEKHGLLPQPLVVVNVTGAAGTIAMRQVKDAQPDGYTYLQVHQSLFTTSLTGRIDFGPDDFEPVVGLSHSCVYLAVPEDSPFQSFEELLEAGRKAPGEIKFADSIGGLTHFPAALMEEISGVKFGFVHTGPTADRFASLTGGHTQFAYMSSGWLERGKGRIRGLLYLGEERLPEAPDMPTAMELGYDVTSCITRRYWAPKGTPQERIDVFADALARAMDTPEVERILERSAEQKRVRRGEELRQDVARDFSGFQRAAPIVRAAIGERR